MVTVLNGAHFKENIKKGLTLIDFWAEWCGPCQQMLPILEEFSKEFAGKVTVAKLNVDECPDIASEFRVMSIPTFILFKDGEVVETLVGSQTKDKFADVIQKYT